MNLRCSWHETDKKDFGFVAVYDGDNRISSVYEMDLDVYIRVGKMLDHFVDMAHLHGKADKAKEIRVCLEISE